MNFMPKCLKNLHVPTIYLNENPLKWVTYQKYLGIYFTNNVSDDRDISRELRPLYARGNTLLRKFGKCSLQVKIQLFKSYCSNMYCCPLWSNFSPPVYKKLKVAYNNVFRFLCNIKGKHSISQLFVNARVDPFNVLIRKSTTNLRNRIINSSNKVLSAVFTSSHFMFNSSIGNHWNGAIFQLTV